VATDADVADQVVETVAAWVDRHVVPNASEFELADEFPEAMVELMKVDRGDLAGIYVTRWRAQ